MGIKLGGAGHYQVVRTHAGWHARLIASNGKTVMSTEVYHRKAAALSAVASAYGVAGVVMNRPPTPHAYLPNWFEGQRSHDGVVGIFRIDVVDER